MANVLTENESEYMIHMTGRQMIGVVITGFVAGVIAWFCGWVFDAAIFRPLLCGDVALTQCVSAPTYSEVAAVVIGTGAGVFGLVRLQVFRPLLVGIAAALSLWGVLANLMMGSWLVGILILASLYAIGYLFYAWVVRIRSLLVAVIIVVVALVLIRYLMTV